MMRGMNRSDYITSDDYKGIRKAHVETLTESLGNAANSIFSKTLRLM